MSRTSWIMRIAMAAMIGWAAAQTRGDGSRQPEGAGASPRFTIQADTNGVVDNLTGLMWARHANLPGGTQSWAQAVAFCRTLDLGGHTDWRLPQIAELRSLMDTNYNRPMLSNASGTAKWQEGDAFKGVREYDRNIAYYWTTTTTAGEPGGAWLVSFFAGQVSQDDETTGAGYVWPVRGTFRPPTRRP